MGDLVDADRDQAGQAVLVEVHGDDTRDDLPDGVPADAQQAGDRGLGHLLRQPRDDVLEVTGVMRARPGPRHGSARTTRQSGHLNSRSSHSIRQRVDLRSR